LVKGGSIESQKSSKRTMRLKSIRFESRSGLITSREYAYSDTGDVLTETKYTNGKASRLARYETQSDGRIVSHRTDNDMDGEFDQISQYVYDKNGDWERTYKRRMDGTITRLELFQMENGLAISRILLDIKDVASEKLVDAKSGKVLSKIDFTYQNGIPSSAKFYRGNESRYVGMVTYNIDENGLTTSTTYKNADGEIENTSKAVYEEGPCKQAAYNSSFASRCVDI